MKLTTNDLKFIKHTKDRGYWIAEDLPFQGFGLTPDEALYDLEREIKLHFNTMLEPLNHYRIKNFSLRK